MSKIEHWIEDELFKMTGMSDRDVVEFLIDLAKRSKSKGKWEYFLYLWEFLKKNGLKKIKKKT